MPRIGILGGSFNPPHLGHLALARHAREELDLDCVLLMPLHTPHHKNAESDPGPRHRLRMCELAVAGEPRMQAGALEVERGGTSYTADTLREVHERNPEAELTFIVGADTARTLPSWHQPGAVLELAQLAVAARPGTSREAVLSAIEQAATPSGIVPTVRFLAMSPMNASSSLARERIADGASLESLLDERVADYIAEHGLYRAGAKAEG